MEKTIQLSVHQLVDFLLRTGDIDNRIFNRSTMSEGSRIHSFYQSQQNSETYLSEYALKQTIVRNEIPITLEGRADGIIVKKTGEFVIDEIKTTITPLDEFFEENEQWHLGQAKCYAYMFAVEKSLNKMSVRLTYIRQGKETDRLVKYYDYSFVDLEDFVFTLLDDYLAFYNIVFRRQENRDISIKDLDFPFNKYRKGQREIAKYCYSIAKNGGIFFCEAPTGIGKTMSTLYPFIKSIELDDKERIFYLTAKSSGKESAYNAIQLLKQNGLSSTEIVITAKDKICFCKGKACNPDECPFAKGYYNKIQTILSYALVSYDSFNYELIERIAKENQVCPFELELDLSLFCDVIICDYNYMFHPISYMKRFFDEDSSHYLALIDEAHNLVDRARDMYSSTICFVGFEKAKKSLRHCKVVKIKNQIAKITKLFKELNLTYPEGETVMPDFPGEIFKIFNNFVSAMQQSVLKDYSKEVTPELLNFYLDVNQFIRISEIVNEKYLLYIEKTDDDLIINQQCLDASSFLSGILNRIKGSVFFSATLSPIDYYMNTLGGDPLVDSAVNLPSPFPRENLKILVAPKVSIRYKNRETSYDEVKQYIYNFVSGKIGNYFVYVPSYEYLNKLTSIFNYEEFDIYVQTKEMDEQEKVAFLNNFKVAPSKTTIGFVVIGGAFGEGIDLVSDRLIGAVIIGIGLPRINFKSDQISKYFTDNGFSGYSYAYANPGMNRVMQAIGRVIRSEEDRGAVLLIDERYMYQDYRKLLRTEWSTYTVVLSPDEIKKEITKFFNN